MSWKRPTQISKISKSSESSKRKAKRVRDVECLARHSALVAMQAAIALKRAKNWTGECTNCIAEHLRRRQQHHRRLRLSRISTAAPARNNEMKCRRFSTRLTANLRASGSLSSTVPTRGPSRRRQACSAGACEGGSGWRIWKVRIGTLHDQASTTPAWLQQNSSRLCRQGRGGTRTQTTWLGRAH